MSQPIFPRATIDYETRSACTLKTHGAWRYSIEPSTEILCLAFRLPFWEEGRTALWHPVFSHLGVFRENDLEALQDLFQWIEDGGLVEAHNVWFEFCIWQNIFVERYGAPAIRLPQWRCSAAKAAACALPRALEKVAAALHVPVQKDLQGQKAMQKMMKPRKPRKAEWEQWVATGETPPQYLWHESRELLEEVWAYCRVDVLAEEAVSQALPDLSPHETRVFLADLAINARGFQLDLNAVTAAQILTRRETQRLNAELTQLTDRAVTKATQRTQMLEWFAYQELDLPDTQAATIDGLLASPRVLKPVVRRALEVVRAVGRSSTAKYGAMAAWMGDDARIRGGLQYHGASTGRWSGKGIQPHNFPRGNIKGLDQERVWGALCSLQETQVLREVPSVLEGLSAGLRGAIIASPGKELYCVDPSTRVLKTDLTWSRADVISLGDRLIAFDEYPGQGKGNQRKFQPSQVTAVSRIRRPRIRVTTTQGSLVVSADHRFLARQHRHRGGWIEAQNLCTGDQLAFLAQPWETDTSHEAGYLAGILDGEGHVASHRIGWAQKPGAVFDRTQQALHDRSFSLNVNLSKWGVNRVDIRGGVGEQLRLLGSVRPSRLLANGAGIWTKRRIWGQRTPIAIVTNLELLPDADVISITTSTGTLITGGFLSHNCADYASIEARVLLWLADDQPALDMFRQNQDIYLDMASTIYDRPCTKEDTLERQLGKVAILGLGYQMGWRKFQTTCGVFGIPIEDDLAERVVRLYREKYYRVKDLWRAHEEAVVLALSRKQPVDCDLVTWEPTERFLYAVLPSGRRIAYPFPKLQKGQTPWGEERTFLSFMGVDSYTRQWVRQTTYGGMLIENLTQSISRDLMADAILRCERLDRYQIVLSVHDELIAEADLGTGSVAKFERLLTHCPAWATGCPVSADGWNGLRYRK